MSISTGFVAGQDVLSFTNASMGNIAGSYDAATGVMTLTSAGSSATLAHWQAALRAVRYTNTSENPSTTARTVSYVVNDGTTNSSALTSTLNVTAVNDAPTSAALTITCLEETPAPINGTTTGTAISALTGLNGLDPEGAVLGLAIVSQLNNGYGSFWYSLNGGTTWTNLSTIANLSTNNALVLGSSARIYFQPGADKSGNIDYLLQYSWDGTDGASSGSMVNLTGKLGGSGAYSSASSLLNFSVTDINDAPTLSVTAIGGNYTGTAVSAFGSASSHQGGSMGESAQKFIHLNLTVSGLIDGTHEKLTVDGSTFSLTHNTTGSTTTNGMTYAVSVTS